jgi:DNA polymerase
MNNVIGLDFETYSDVDLFKCGLDNYVSSPHFRVLLASVVTTDGVTIRLDFVHDDDALSQLASLVTKGALIAAHNAGFEQAVLKRIGLDLPSSSFVDTAMLARAAGYGGSLQNASTQLLGEGKIEEGYDLIRLFCIPGEAAVAEGRLAFDPAIIEGKEQAWSLFGAYCDKDAVLSRRIALMLMKKNPLELRYSGITMDMNAVGWPVDLGLVRKMNEMYKANLEQEIEEFVKECDAFDLNLNSTPQLIAWCKERGIRATSFDEKHVASLLKRLASKVEAMQPDDPKFEGYHQVIRLLQAKQALGGSSLKKLDVIEAMTSSDGRLRHQYLHVGAGATFRTTGRGVQMQNLKRLHGMGDDVREVLLDVRHWDNETLAANLRQCFTASDPQGQLIVGDFSSVESRGLAWQAGEQWKLDAYARGQDLYKVQAGQMFGIPADQVTKEQRQIGKVAELSCGYGAGPAAVKDFAAKMGVDLTEGESTTLVKDWRAANEGIVDYWATLDKMLHDVLTAGSVIHQLPNGTLKLHAVQAPASLMQQTNRADLKSISIMMDTDAFQFRRVLHGVQATGRNLTYWKPSERKTGDPWVDRYTDPKTKQLRFYTVYGGKLSGLLTQSLCRELFFSSLVNVTKQTKHMSNVQIVGQFHDEIVLDWVPGPWSLNEAITTLEREMSSTELVGFPLGAEVKSAYRYIK